MIKRLLVSYKSHVIALTVFHVLFLIIALTNFPSGKWFIGWDSIHPEFNFALNFKRALFAGWQENYGVGTLTGHGFAALLPHTLITFLMSLILPLSAIRPVFTLLCFYLGGLGAYFLTRVVLKLVTKHFHTHYWQNHEWRINAIALLSSLYYLFNLGTVQNFYLQLEAFIVHFASLPWLFLSAIYLLERRTRKRILFFFIVNLFATIQGFIPSLFVAYATALAIFLVVYIVSHHGSKIALKGSVLVVLLTFFINAYWFFPVAYFTFTRGGTFMNSYNNLMSTPEFVQKSQKYGDLADVALLKGFYWDSYELGGKILSPWIEHQEIGLIPVIGYLLFGLAAVGLFASLFWIRDWLVKALSLVGLYFFTSIAVSTPPFSWATSVLQWVSPTYNQAFRTTFTKFSLGTGFAYSILFAIGLLFLITLFHKVFKHRVAVFGSLLVIFISLVWYALPLFQGNLIYKKLLIDVPQSYFELMDYFKTQSDGKIADFPQDCPEGWYSYQWDYFGSGFLWYGVKQPFLARSFDVWSRYNENYYWELIQAIREKDFARAEKIFDKYGVKWIMYDQNFIYCRDQHGVFTTSDFIEYVESSQNYRLVKKFEAKDTLPIRVYERVNAANSYVLTTNNLKNVGPTYTFNDRDVVYNDYGTYSTNNKSYFDTYYPFGILFSKRGVREQEVIVTANDNEIVVTSSIPKEVQGYSLRLPAYSSLEKHVPVSVSLNPISDTTHEVLLTYQFFKMSVDGQVIGNPKPTLKLGEVEIRDINNASVYVNSTKVEKQEDGTYKSAFYFWRENTVHVVLGNQVILFEWNDKAEERSNELVYKETTVTLPTFSKGEFQIVIPKTKNDAVYGFEKFNNLSEFVPVSCGEPTPSERNKHEFGNDEENEYVRLISQNSKQCLTIPLSQLYTSIGYVFEVKARHVSGGNLRMFVKNKDRPVGLDVYLTNTRDFETHYFVMPPTLDSEIGYDFVFENFSYNNQKMTNDIAGVAAWYLPYNFLKSIKLERLGFGGTPTINQPTLRPLHAEHPNDIFDKVNVDANAGNYLLLSQGFDRGWVAFTPSLQLLSNHVLVNNWMNGWKIDQSNETVYIFFWPQLLEFIGFGLLIFPVLIFLSKKQSHSPQLQN